MTRGNPPQDAIRRMRGFEPASGLVAERIRRAGESRGFAMTRLLTHWAEVVGEDLARVTRPERVAYGREGLGATLTVWTQGAVAPLVEMQKDRIRERVNAVYGYSAVARVVLTQTGAAGFAEAQAPFAGPPRDPAPVPPAALAAAEGVTDPGLRAALARLAANVMQKKTEGLT